MYKNHETVKKTVSAIMLMLIAVLVVLYARGDYDFTFIKRPEQEKIIPKSPDETVTEPQDTEIAVKLPPVPAETQTEKQISITAPEILPASSLSGYKITNTPYSADTHMLAEVTPKSELSPYYTVSKGKVRTVSVTTDARGSNNATENFGEGELPFLTPYFGYIIKSTPKGKLLCSSDLTVLCDISDYDTVGYCDLTGHALFKKDGKYYYFYDGQNRLPGTIVLDEMTADDASEYDGTTEPNALYLVNTDSEVTPTLSSGRGMTECTVDENYFNDISVNSTYYDRNSTGIYRLCEYRTEKRITNQWMIDDYNNALLQYQSGLTSVLPQYVEPEYEIINESFHWWYINEDGNLATNFSYSKAFEFSDNGLAFVIRDDKDEYLNKLCAVNKSGSVMFYAYGTSLFFTERGNAKVYDGHYLPDTLGSENTGMLRFQNGLCAVRRKLYDTTNGYVYISDNTAVVNSSGQLVNLPANYETVAYSDGKILITKAGKYRYMNGDGSYLTPLCFTDAKPFCEGLAVCQINGKYGMIDTEANTVLPFEYNYISSSSDGVTVAYKDGEGWRIFAKMTNKADAEKTVNPVLMLKKRLIAQQLKINQNQENNQEY